MGEREGNKEKNWVVSLLAAQAQKQIKKAVTQTCEPYIYIQGLTTYSLSMCLVGMGWTHIGPCLDGSSHGLTQEGIFLIGADSPIPPN